MPLFNESLESIAQAIVTVKRALKAGVIEKADYKGLNDYLAKRAKDFKIKNTHLAKAKKDLDDELEAEVEEFFMDEGEALCKMAEELLEEFDEKPAAEAATDDWDKQAAACKAWLKMNNEERAAMAALASAWQKSR
jgi:hypothetical protein